MSSIFTNTIKLQATALAFQFKRERPNTPLTTILKGTLLSRGTLELYMQETFGMRAVELYKAIYDFKPSEYGFFLNVPCIVGQDDSVLYIYDNKLIRRMDVKKEELEIRKSNPLKYKTLTMLLGVNYESM